MRLRESFGFIGRNQESAQPEWKSTSRNCDETYFCTHSQSLI